MHVRPPVVLEARGSAAGKPREDRAAFDLRLRRGVVADGVTRDRNEQGIYRIPSSAAFVAETICDAALAAGGTGLGPRHALETANRAIAHALATGPAWLAPAGTDRPGAVAAVADLSPDGREVSWAYVGDCGLALLDEAGTLLEITDDDVAAARRYFPTNDVDAAERKRVIRDVLRNAAPAVPGSYGVLTGQRGAAHHIRSGRWTRQPTDVLVIFTDGLRPALSAPRLRQQLAHLRATIPSGEEAAQRRPLSGDLYSGDDVAALLW